jgi:hypothetical protein
MNQPLYHFLTIYDLITVTSQTFARHLNLPPSLSLSLSLYRLPLEYHLNFLDCDVRSKLSRNDHSPGLVLIHVYSSGHSAGRNADVIAIRSEDRREEAALSR